MDRRPDRRRGPVATGSRTRRPLRRFLPLLVLGLAVVAGGSSSAGAHSVLESSRPSDGTTVGASSGTVTLTFSEAPDPSLSTVQLTDHLGRVADLPDAEAAPDDPTTLVLRTGDLGRGAYTVVWRVVSRLDGHATAGSLSFGVQVPPLDRSATVGEADAPVPVSVLEVVGRWLLITGLIVSFGAAAAVALVLDDPPPRTWLLVGGAAAVAGLGLVLLAVAQRAAAGVGLGPFLWTTVGTAVLGRALALAVVAAGVVGLERRTASSMGPLLVALGAAGAMFVDAAAGHAAAAPTLAWAAIALQATHLAAVGIWIGGLVTLLIGIRGAPSDTKVRAVRRFSSIAGAALVVVLLTGTARTLGEVDSPGQLITTTYGRFLLVKIAALAVLVALGAAHRARSVPAAGTDLRPLRRISAAELAAATVAIGAAGLLMALAPPAPDVERQPVAQPAAIVVEATDAATSLRASIEVSPGSPGPNRFVAHLTDAAGAPVKATSVELQLEPIDGGDAGASVIALEPEPGGGFSAIGEGLARDGLWGLTLVVRLGDDERVLPGAMATRCEATPLGEGRPQIYALDLGTQGSVQGLVGGIGRMRYQVHFTFLDPSGKERRIGTDPVISAWHPGTEPTLLPDTRLGPGHVAGEAQLGVGDWSFMVTGQDANGAPLFGCFEEAIGG